MTPFELKQRDYCCDFFVKALDDPNLKEHVNMEGLSFLASNFGLFSISDFFQSVPKSTFLTVGDAYCGKEAVYIRSFGHRVHACDQAPSLIAKAKEWGLIDEWSAQDVNELGFKNEEFDFVFSKEVLHHLSMPYKGLWEMLRVCKKGTIIIEPNGDGMFDRIREQNRDFNIFEPVGNFCFSFRAHELSKIGASYGIKYLAYTYTSGYNAQVKEIVDSWNPTKSVSVEIAKLVLLDQNKQSPIDKDMIVFFYLKDEGVFNLINSEKYTKVRVP